MPLPTPKGVNGKCTWDSAEEAGLVTTLLAQKIAVANARCFFLCGFFCLVNASDGMGTIEVEVNNASVCNAM